MAAEVRRVFLVACGSFNPITNMHLRLFELARDALHRTGRYEVVGGIISPVNDGYKKKGLIPSRHRVEMCKLAVQTSNWIRVDDWEACYDGWQRTALVMQHMEQMVTTGSGTEEPRAKQASNVGAGPAVKLLCGGDLLESFATPGLWLEEDIEELVGHFGLVVVTRAGSNPQQFIYESDALSKHESNIHIVTEWITNEISATRIRRSLRRKESVRYLIPDSVLDYITKNHLYQD